MMMDTRLAPLEEHVLAYYLFNGAAELNMVPRWWPPIELSSIVEDKIRFAVSRFDITNRVVIENVGRVLLETLIARDAFSTSQTDYGPMYQFQRPAYQAWLTGARAASPILAQAAAAGPDFWKQTFERLKG
jgi:hypothetical protein